ncbi:hypothetical protein ACFYY1_27580 [Streptomyces sp. NPDC001890]|uniref:hypothetical protein n=1 Tax=Streptomyces sp. NPDC001890 TaxID=3364620 RepID=UPI00369E478A
MAWASWTTCGVFSGRGGVLTDEVGVLSGDLTVHTTWADDSAQVTVQYSGAIDWYTMSGSPVRCCSEEDSRRLHDAAVQAVRNGEAATVPVLPRREPRRQAAEPAQE